MKRPRHVAAVMRTLAREIDGLDLPAVEKISQSQEEDPFQVLIATMLSARTQDATTLAASTRLFNVARTPRAMGTLTVRRIERLIYPVSFYRHKARHVKAACRLLVDRFNSRVPTTMDELLVLPGVGRKTANLVLILGFRSGSNICVDTHVHRISNRLGWVATRTPDETERALYAATDQRWWPMINLYLVTWGQNVCRPVYPRCGGCALRQDCPQIGVTKRGRRRKPGTEVSRKPGTEVSRKRGTEVSRKRGTEVSRKRGTEVSRKPGTEVSRKPGTEVSRKRGTEVSRKPGTEVSMKRGRR